MLHIAIPFFENANQKPHYLPVQILIKMGFYNFFLEERQFLIAVLRPKVHLIDYINVHTPDFGSCQSYNSKIGI